MKMIYDSYLRRNRNNSSNGKNNNNNGSINGEICHPNDFNAYKTGADEMDELDGYIIAAESLVINKELGIGEFGVVQQGVWTNKEGRRIQVAIKCLSAARLENSQSEFMKEATIMHRISHENIVTLYGVVLEPSIQLVTELAPLRSLLECLKEPTLVPHFPVTSLCLFATQIADGMAYLESKRLIHRDLAARNILVFTKDKVKVSDFGLSRALGVGKDYYQSNFNVNLKLPIAWCAPECINYLKFTSQSDVWAYGVTLWEMFSFGFQPWAALTGQQILETIDQPNFQRLEQPECCPKEYYQLMLKCWTHEPHLRPKFSEIVNLLPDCKPELLQAIRNSDTKKIGVKSYLLYKIGDIVTVIDKFCSEAPDSCWKGITAERKTGYFNPGDFVAYLGQNLPSTNSPGNSFMQHFMSGNTSTNGSASSNGNSHNSLASTITSTVLQSSKFLRGFLDSKGNNHNSHSSPHATRKSRLRPEMISKPQGDLKHTGHVGADGVFFGDVSFLEGKYQHLSKYSSNDAIESKSKISISNPITTYNRNNQATNEKCNKLMSSSFIQENHEYHEISDDDEVGPQDSPSFEVLDFGPSLMEEVFRELDHIKPDLNNDAAESETMINESGINVKNEVRELNLKMSKEVNNCKKKQSAVKPISEAEQNELDSAIAMAKDIANRTMLEDDLDLTKNDSPKTPNSPNKRKFSFKFPTHKSSPKGERRTFCEETESIGNIIESITPAAKEAYLSLVDKGVLSGTVALSSEILENRSEVCPSSSTADSASLVSNLPTAEQTTISPTEMDSNPLRMLRTAGIGKVLRPKVRGNRSFSQPRLPTTAQTAGLARVASSRSQLGSPPPVPINEEPSVLCPFNVTSNALPLPPRDRSRPLIQLKTHQRRHPLVIPVEMSGMTESSNGSGLKSGEELGHSVTYKHDSSQVLQRHVPVLKQVSCPQAPAAFLSGYNKSINTNTNHANSLHINSNVEKITVPSSSINTNRAYLSDDLTESLESEIQKALDNIKIGQLTNSTVDNCSKTNDQNLQNGSNSLSDSIYTDVATNPTFIESTKSIPSKPPPIIFNTQIVEPQNKANNGQESNTVVRTSQSFHSTSQGTVKPTLTTAHEMPQISDEVDVVKPLQGGTPNAFLNTTTKANPKRTIDSDEVRVMQKVLVNEVNLTSQECTNILDSTDWDIHKAIKCVRLRQQLRNHNITVDCNWAQMLAKFNWNIRQASNYLIATQGVPEDTTEV